MSKFKPIYMLVIVMPLIFGWIVANLSVNSSSDIGFKTMDLSLVLGFLMGFASLSLHYIKSKWLWLSILTLPLLCYAIKAPEFGKHFHLFEFLIPTYLFTFFSVLIVKHVFYNAFIFRFRTILLGISGAIGLSIYLSHMHMLMGFLPEPGFWSKYFLQSLYIFIFIGFGLSMADMIIIRKEVKELRNVKSKDLED